MNLRPVLAAVALTVFVAGCDSGDGRPSDEAWGVVWEVQRASVPAAGGFIDRGEDLCGELVGDLRSARKDLLPTPIEALDGPVDAWLSHAESIAFDCPTDDPDRLRGRLHELDVLAAEVDAGLVADGVTSGDSSSTGATTTTT